MITAQDKKLIQDLISENQTENAIQKFRATLEKAGTGGSFMADLLSISARFNNLMEEKNRAVLFKDEEEVLRNRIHVDLGNLLEAACRLPEKKSPEKDKPTQPAKRKARSASPKPKSQVRDAAPATLPPTPTVQTDESQGLFSGWAGWILLIAAGALGYFLLFGWPGNEVKVNNLQLCTLDAWGQDYCCMQNQPLIPLRNSGAIYVSLHLESKLSDPLISGNVFAKNAALIQTQPIHLVQEQGSTCYSGMITLPPAASWAPGTYVLEISVNGEPGGSREFSISY